MFKKYPRYPDEDSLKFIENFEMNTINKPKIDSWIRKCEEDYKLDQEKTKLHRQFQFN